MKCERYINRKQFLKAMGICTLAAASASLLSGCQSASSASSAVSSAASSDASSVSSSAAASKTLKVMASFYPVYDFAQKIGGDHVEVTNMVPAGTEPHDWEPSTTDITDLESADVFIYSGAGMEHWVDSVLGSLSNQNLISVEASTGITMRDGYKDEDGDVGTDPHVWLAPENAKVEMENIKNAFVEADPDNAADYEANYEKWSAECDTLDEEFRTGLENVSSHDIVVSHEAFGYLCDAYGLTQLGIEGIEADSEPDPARMAEIQDFVKANNVKVIFSEELVSPKVAQTIADATGAQMEELNPLEGLTDDEIAAGEDYFSVMRSNLDELKAALQ